MLYACIIDGQIKEQREFVDPPPDMSRKGMAWLPIVDTKPAYSEKAQVISGPVVTVEAAQVTRVWSVRNKTAQELDAEKEAAVSDRLNMLVFDFALDHENRLRALEAKPAITRMQFRDALKARLT